MNKASSVHLTVAFLSITHIPIIAIAVEHTSVIWPLIVVTQWPIFEKELVQRNSDIKLSLMVYLHLHLDPDSDSDIIPLVGNKNWNLNPTLCSVKSST